MRVRVICLVVIACAALPLHAGSVLSDYWIKVQQAVATEDRELFDERIHRLEQTAGELHALKLTPYAEALMIWAENHDGELAEAAAVKAQRLDPELPSTYFLAASRSWNRGGYADAARLYLAGWWALFVFEPTRLMLAASSPGWVLLVLGWTLIVAVVVQALRFLRHTAHDALELSLLLFRKPNAVVLAAAILLLPVLAGFGFVWLAVYLFVLSWMYMKSGQRVTAIVTCALLALVVPSLAVWQDLSFRQAPLTDRVASLLEQRRIDPSTLREFADMEQEMNGIGSFHLVLGELTRMHGDSDAARVQFEKAALARESDPTPLIVLGNLSLEDGDVQRAIQRYNAATELDSRSALAYHNLSSAYDQIRRFQEGDQARSTAREIAGESSASFGIRGRDPRIRYPVVGAAQLAEYRNELTVDVRLANTIKRSTDRLIATMWSPFSIPFWMLGVIGVLLLMARSQWMWVAQACTKCGRVFCSQCKTSTESSTYCSQCISVFLKRDGVSIDQQTAKQARIRRWEIWSSIGQRVVGTLIPGSHQLFDGRAWLGLVIGFVAWLCLSGALFWLPGVMPSIEPQASVVPLQILLVIAFLALWLRTAVVTWVRR